MAHLVSKIPCQNLHGANLKRVIVNTLMVRVLTNPEQSGALSDSTVEAPPKEPELIHIITRSPTHTMRGMRSGSIGFHTSVLECSHSAFADRLRTRAKIMSSDVTCGLTVMTVAEVVLRYMLTAHRDSDPGEGAGGDHLLASGVRS